MNNHPTAEQQEIERLRHQVHLLETRLAEQEQTVRALIDASPDAIFLMEADGTLLLANRSLSRRLQLSPESLATFNGFDSLPDTLAATRRAAARRAIATGLPAHFVDTRDGMILANTLYPVPGPGTSTRLAVFSSDITEQRRIEEALRRSERTLKAILDACTETISLVSLDGTILVANEAMARRFQTSVDTLLGRNVFDFFPPETARRRKACLDDAVRTGQPVVQIDQNDGRTLEATIYPVQDEDGRITRAAVFTKDISRRIEDRQAVQHSRALLNDTQRIARIGGWEWNVATATMTWTDQTYRIHGLDPEGQPLSSKELFRSSLACYRAEDRPVITAAFRRCAEQGEPYDLRFPFRTADGRNLWIRTMAEPIRQEDGRIALVRGNIIDITREQQVEQLLQARLRLSESSPFLSLDALLSRVMDEAETLTGSCIGFFHFVEPDQRNLSLQAWSRNTLARFCTADNKSRHYQVEQAGVWVDCIHARKPVIHNDFPALPHRRGTPPGHAEIRRELVVPIFRDDKIVAVFGVGNKEQPYDQEDVALVASLGDMAWDIVLRKRAEEALRHSEERYRMQIELALDGILLLSAEGIITAANRSMCALLGLEERHIQGRHLRQLPFTPESLAQYPFRFDLLLKGETVNSDRTLVAADGTRIPVEMRTGRMPDGSYQSIFRDATERKKAEQRLKEQADFNRRILDSTDAHIAILDPRGIIVDVNTPWTRFAEANGSIDASKLGPGASYFCAWSPEQGDTTNAAEAFAGIRQVLRGDRDSFTIEYPCPSTELRWFSLRAFPLRGGNGHVIVSHTDISALKQTEHHLTAALAEKEVLLREVHHRVKNNLAAIISLMDMQRRLLADPKGRDILTELSGRIRSMSLVHEKLYRSDNLAQIDFQGYIRALISHLRTSFGSPRILCQTEAQGVNMPLDLAVPCGMIVNELVTNALKYAFPDGQPVQGNDTCRIRIRMTREHGAYTLAVADNGVGLPPGFDWAGAKTLGMVLVRMLGQHQLGGRYELDQRQGLSFTLTFSEQRGKK